MNGWTNRETWVINLHLGDHITEIFDETNVETLADCLEEYVYDLLDQEEISGLFADLIDLGCVNWRELAKHYVCDMAA